MTAKWRKKQMCRLKCERRKMRQRSEKTASMCASGGHSSRNRMSEAQDAELQGAPGDTWVSVLCPINQHKKGTTGSSFVHSSIFSSTVIAFLMGFVAFFTIFVSIDVHCGGDIQLLQTKTRAKRAVHIYYAG
ncbi:hypothetical protein TREES_T100008370 [Tupaia chinensis]|uniref:60S ribosomal protein L41 n=1 Tax=Tupaia chinensis TaxID=246437 RepID=L9LA14_TUPCH|nr:hypothetical protein TREES_T100008370 [Tupaia chinensis]